MRFTIERIRLLVVVAAALVLGALGIFLFAAKWRNRLVRRDLPQRLAKEIQQQASGFDFVHTFGAHSQYKIHASQEVQLRNNHVLLHQVSIELYADNGSRIDQIAGDTFEFDQKSGLAIAEGPVEMVLTQPGGSSQPAGAPAAQRSISPATPRQIHVKTSGVTFDRNTGIVSTMQHVDFTMTQGSGSSKGATYDSQKGFLTLDEAVDLTTQRGGNTVRIRAAHAEFDRGAQVCWMRAVKADYRNAQAGAAKATFLFRPDGSAQQLNATDGFTLATSNGGHVAAPSATMDFDEHSQPRHGHLEGGVTLDSVKEDRTVHGVSPTADLDFAGQGHLRHAHFEHNVVFTSDQTSPGTGQSGPLHVTRTWRSPVADLDFRDAGKGQVEPATLHGTGGVVITSETVRGTASAAPSRMAADDVTGTFGPNSTLQSLTGIGHAGIEQTTATGAKQTASADRLTAQLEAAPTKSVTGSSAPKNPPSNGAPSTAMVSSLLQSAELDGRVVLFEQPVAKSGQPQPPIRANAGKAVYEGAGDWLHLTLNPRVENGAVQLTADKVDVSQQSGDAFAHGNVKASWNRESSGASSRPSTGGSGATNSGSAGIAFGGNGAAHVIASEAQMNESTGEATFRGSARLWQQANSVSAPVIVLNQHAQTLVARTTNSADPVRAVLLSAGGALVAPGATHSTSESNSASSAKPSAPSVIRVRGGDLWYSDAEHRATMRGGVLGAVVADTGSATSSSDQVDLRLMPASPTNSQAQVDRMTASGHVVLSARGRHGTGEQLVYSGTTGDYVLTGTSSAPPRLSDPDRGSVTGEALIFHSRDDSVSIEGGGHQTTTQTTAPEVHMK